MPPRFLASCASLPLPDQDRRTVLAISISTGRTSYSGFPLAYELGLRESPRRVSLTVREGVAVFDGLPAGRYTIERLYTLPGPELAGGVYLHTGQPDPVGPWSFTLREGEITILPVALRVTVQALGPETHLQSLEPFEVDRQRVIAALSRRANFAAWRVAGEAPAGPLPLQAPPPRRVDDRFKWD